MKLYKKKYMKKQGQAKQKKRNEIWEKWEILQEENRPEFSRKKNTKKFVFCFSFPACGEIAILWLAILSGGKKGPLYNSVVGRGGPIKSNKTESNAFFL